MVAEALQKQNARVAELRQNAGDLWTEYDLVFPSEIGTPIHPSNVNHELARLERLAGVEHHRVHDWRHTAATKMLSAGVPDRIVMEVCGCGATVPCSTGTSTSLTSTSTSSSS